LFLVAGDWMLDTRFWVLDIGCQYLRPLQNAPFCPIPASGSNFNPQNTQCIPACPVGPADRTGVVKIFAFLGLEQKLTFFKGLISASLNN
jgi:hypothetical protein